MSSTKSSWPVRKDLLEFNSRYERMMSWLIQKEKMASLMVPVGCELAVLSNQLLQTRVGQVTALMNSNSFYGWLFCTEITHTEIRIVIVNN